MKDPQSSAPGGTLVSVGEGDGVPEDLPSSATFGARLDMYNEDTGDVTLRETELGRRFAPLINHPTFN